MEELAGTAPETHGYKMGWAAVPAADRPWQRSHKQWRGLARANGSRQPNTTQHQRGKRATLHLCEGVLLPWAALVLCCP